MFRSGRSRKTQPEKTRRHSSLRGVRTSSCTKAPTSCISSQGAAVSHARRRIMASPTRSASPGFMRRSRVRPLRLLSRPITATRSFIGVAPARLPIRAAGAFDPPVTTVVRDAFDSGS